jgi:O-antigen ligase
MVIYFIDLSIVVYGRTGYIAFILTSPLIIYNMIGKKSFLLTITISIMAIVILFMSPTVQKRMNLAKESFIASTKGDTDSSLGWRIEMWKMSYDLFLENPLTGTGSTGFKSEWERNKPHENADNFATPHNTFIYIASGYGLPGIITIIWLFIVLFRSGWRGRNNIIGFSILSFSLIFFIGSLANTMIMGSVKTAWATVFIGLQGALNKNG